MTIPQSISQSHPIKRRLKISTIWFKLPVFSLNPYFCCVYLFLVPPHFRNSTRQTYPFSVKLNNKALLVLPFKLLCLLPPPPPPTTTQIYETISESAGFIILNIPVTGGHKLIFLLKQKENKVKSKVGGWRSTFETL